jgi:VIT1/CCC1 family predicted Fe2+/Mn2+ transporter
MKNSLKKGLSFGLTSAVITTLGLMVGLNSSTGSKLAVISGILVIALADAFSDSLGVHISEESNKENSARHVWEATIATFLTKAIFALSFLIPFIFFKLSTSILISVVWGIIILSVLSYKISNEKERKNFSVVFEHLLIATVVILISYYLGLLINNFFSI